MPRRIGRVTEQSGAYVQIDLQDTYASCESCLSGCALLSLARAFRGKRPRCRLRVSTKAPAPVGSAVELTLSPRQLLFAAFLAYGLPLGGLMIGAMLGGLLAGGSDGLVLLGAAAGVIPGVLVGKYLHRARPLEPSLEGHG